MRSTRHQRVYQWLRTSFAAEPPPLEERRLQVQYFRRAIIAIALALGVIALLQLFVLRVAQARTVLIFGSGFTILGLAYAMLTPRRLYLTIHTLFSVGWVFIIVNALTQPPPQYDINYLLFLPLVSALLLSFRALLVWSVVAFVSQALFSMAVATPDNALLMFKLTQQSLLFNIIIIAAGYQRQRLEDARRAMAQQQDRTAMMDLLLSSLSHDLRTPLTVINNSAYLLRRKLGDAAPARHINAIENAVQRLERMVENSMMLSRLEFRHDASTMQQDLRAVVRESMAQLEQLAEMKAVHLHAEYAESMPHVLANPEDLARIAGNLIENAIHYSDAGDTVRVRVYHADDQAHLTVTDEGMGIEPEQLADIFEPFYRADEARSAETGGNGLGLSLVKKTLAYYEGDVRVDSTPQLGSTFHVTLPLTPLAPNRP